MKKAESRLERLSICFSGNEEQSHIPFGNSISAGQLTRTKGIFMGDKSPKAAQKQKSQQAAKVAGANKQKQQAAAAKKPVEKKK